MRNKISMLIGTSVCLLSFFCTAEEIEILPLDVVSYEQFSQGDPESVETLVNALYEKGIVGIRGVPGYVETLQEFVQGARAFSALPEEVKEAYAPNHDAGDLFLGYEKGKEKFRRPDGKWVIDDLKVSYYAFIPDDPRNKWPRETDLKPSFAALGTLLANTAEMVMEKIHLIGDSSGIYIDEIPRVARMLYYQKCGNTCLDNPLWCGAHYDHGLFTALTPSTYFVEGEQVPEPAEAGLFVRIGDTFKKIKADPEVMMFQVAEFGQLVLNDAIRATEHRVHKSSAPQIERYAMALFFDAPMDTVIRSVSTLTQDARYGGIAGDPCTYLRWHEESFNRYIVKE